MNKLIIKKSFLFFIIGLLILLTIGFQFRDKFRAKACNIVFRFIYQEELGIVQKYVSMLADGDVVNIRKLSTEDSDFLKPPGVKKRISQSKKFLSNVDIYSMTVCSVVRKDDKLLIIIYFERNSHLDMSFQLVERNSKWLVDVVSFSEMWPWEDRIV